MPIIGSTEEPFVMLRYLMFQPNGNCASRVLVSLIVLK